MNRHNKFYAELAHQDDDDDYDSDDYDEDDYYDEEDGEYYEEYPVEPPVSAARPAPSKYRTIHPDADQDYELLDMAIPELHTMWKTNAPREIPLSEEEAVAALRTQNYDLPAAVNRLMADRDAAKKRTASSAPARVLKIATKHDTNGARDSDHDESMGETTSAAQDSRRAAGNSQRSEKTRHYDATVQPDMSKPDCTFVIAGHVDHGKSTTLGQLLVKLGKISEAEVEKNARMGRGEHKESFKYAWVLDQSEEERRRGVTIDSGSFCFETEHRRIHILDAPGHKDFVLNMISSATQADAALLVVSAAKGEFETGVAHGTKDHLLVLKTLGVGSIVVVVNKMDSVNYDKARFDYIKMEMTLLLKQMHMHDDTVRGFVPIAAMKGTNMCEKSSSVTPWYDGPTLVDLLDSCPLETRLLDAPLRLSLQDVDSNTLYCKVESGRVFAGTDLLFVPANVRITARTIAKPTVGGKVDVAFAGDTIEISTNSSVLGLYAGCVGGAADQPAVVASTDFEAHIQTFPGLTKSILPGASFTMVVHALTVPVKVMLLVSKMNLKTGEWSKGMVKCVPPSSQALVVFRSETKLALETAENCRALGRFVLQQEGETVAGGLVRRLMTSV